jgi:hypothetical protein
VYRPVRCLFEFTLLQMYCILDVHLLLYSCARGQGRLNRTERTILHWSINRDLDRVIHITRHNRQFYLLNFTLYMVCIGTVFSLVFVLLSDKQQQTYQTLIDELRHCCPSSNPKSIMVNFENPATSVFESSFNTTTNHITISGCFFHS